MALRKYSKIIFFCLFVLGKNLFSQIVVQGVVTDNGAEFLGNGAEAIENALVTLTDQYDATRTFSAYTDAQGYYAITIPSTGVDRPDSYVPDGIELLQNYPNPFNPSTVIGFYLDRPVSIRIEVANILGQRVKTLFDGNHPGGAGRVTWNATDGTGQGVPSGVYIYTLETEGVRIHRKMLLMDGHAGQSGAGMASQSGEDGCSRRIINRQISDQYLLSVTGENILLCEQDIEITSDIAVNVTVIRTVTDLDGNVYQTVKIGDQWWMAENLKVIHYRNGDEIPNVTDDTEWSNLTTGAYCNYDNDSSNVSTYGRLYNWHAVSDYHNITPTGWHVPSDTEWHTLVDYLGGDGVAGGKLKEAGTAHWQNPNTGATNESGFSALPGGYRYDNGLFNYMAYYASFWSATVYSTHDAWVRYLDFSNSAIYRGSYYKQGGFSVRCVRD